MYLKTFQIMIPKIILENIQKVEFFIFQEIFGKYPELIPENILENIRKISRNWNFSENIQKLEKISTRHVTKYRGLNIRVLYQNNRCLFSNFSNYDYEKIVSEN